MPNNAQYPDKNLPWPISWEGVKLIAESEGCRLNAYKDIVGVWTIGWGETLGVKGGDRWAQQKADEHLCRRLAEFDRHVGEKLVSDETDFQRAAFVSLAYNIGISAFSKSSALRLHNAGKFEAVPAAIKLWDKAGGKVVTGLVRRREAEAELYKRSIRPPERLKATGQSPDADTDCERSLAQSSTMQSGAVAAGASGLAAAAEASRQFADIHYSLASLPAWLILALSLAGASAGGIVCYRIWKRKQEGKG